MAGYIGNAPVAEATQTRDKFTATSGQTSFATSGYTPGYLDVYYNGIHLDPTDFTATNGSDVVLNVGASTGDELIVVAWKTFNATTISEASVTQHEAALTITESQISDLQSYLTSETNTSLSLAGNTLTYTDETGTSNNIDLSAYLDDTTNTVLSAALSGNTITFTREDSTTFNLDVTNLYDDTNLVTSVNGQTGAVTVSTDLVSDTTPQLGGNLDTNGFTIDGRDIASDGSKLDGIESGATADQTASEILTLIKTVDGVSSGLDADTVDGLHASDLGGAKGGGSDKIFYENDQTVTTNYTITANKNAMSAGPITVNNGVTVTVPSGATWTIV